MRLLDDQGAQGEERKSGDSMNFFALVFVETQESPLSSCLLKQRGEICSIRSNSGKGTGCSASLV